MSEPKPPACGRWRFYGKILFRPASWSVLVAWSVLSNSETISGKLIKPLVSPEFWAKVERVFTTQNWPIWVWAIGALVILLAGVLDSSYVSYSSAQSRIADLEGYQKPQLRLSVDPGNPDFVIDDPTLPARRVRVKVENISGKTIDNVKVRLMRMEPPALLGALPIPLLHTHWEGGTLNPEYPLMVDVFYKAAQQDAVILTHGVQQLGDAAGLPMPAIPSRVVWIQATGRDCPKCEERFVLCVLENGLIRLEAVDSS